MTQSPEWIVTADARQATLYACRRGAAGALELERVSAISNRHEAEHRHERPALLGGAERRGSVGRSAGHPAPHAAAQDHTAEEELRAFARELTEWLRRGAGVTAPGRVVIFAPARFLGVIREVAASFPAPIDFTKGELTHLEPHDLARHPLVAGLHA